MSEGTALRNNLAIDVLNLNYIRVGDALCIPSP